MTIQMSAWVIHCYRDGVYQSTVSEPTTKESARRYAETYNRIYDGEQIAVVREVKFEADAPELLALLGDPVERHAS